MINIALVTIKEVFKKKLLHIINIAIIVYLILFTIFVYKFMAEINNSNNDGSLNIFMQSTGIVLVFGFYFSSMLVAFLTIMSSVSIVSGELENNVISTILVRPIKRYKYILGKIFGLNIFVLAYTTIIFLLLFLIGYIFKVPALSNITIDVIVKSLMFFLLQPIAIISLAIFGGVYFKTIANGVFVICIYLLGIIGSYVEQIGTLMENDTMVSIGILTSLISPFETTYRMMSAYISNNLVLSPLMGSISSSVTPNTNMIIYILFYIIVLPGIAIYNFNKRDI